jgi:hypothetical protein
MESLKEFAIALTRILLGLFIMVAGLVLLDIFVYLGATGSTFNEKVALAFSDGYDQNFSRTYDVGFQKGYETAYDRGYQKGYEIGRDRVIREEVGRLVELRNPTLAELKDFLAADDTSENDYISGEYVCYDFATDLNNRAEEAGIRAAYVRIRSANWAHALVGFETSDRGIVFIEPQSDKKVDVEVGKPYPWWQVGAASPERRQDPIEEIQIIW